MTKTEQLAEKYADANYTEYSTEGGWCVESDYTHIEKAYMNGAQNMLERVLDFMRNFKNGNGEFPLYDYIGNVRKAMEE